MTKTITKPRTRRKPPSPSTKVTGDPAQWTEYQQRYLGRKKPLLYPVTVEMKDISGDLAFDMRRMQTPLLGRLRSSILDNVPQRKKTYYSSIIKHYSDYFKAIDGHGAEDEAPLLPPSVLDFNGVKRSVIYLIYLMHDNWTFSGHRQFVCLNDDHHNPTVRQVGTFSGNRGIIVRRSGDIEDRLKYDYYVTVDRGNDKSCDNIVDPRDSQNPGEGFH